mgnify:CR=1 FL=1
MGLEMDGLNSDGRTKEDDFLKKSREKLKELQKILGQITSLRNGRGGDLFFRGLAKTF